MVELEAENLTLFPHWVLLRFFVCLFSYVSKPQPQDLVQLR